MDDEKAILDKQLKGSLALTSLIAKVAAACDATGGVAKEGKNEQQGYAYVKAADVAKAIRHELFSRGVMVIPNELPPEFTVVELPSKFKEDTKRTMTECHLGVDYLLTDGNESLHFMAYGVARDSGDKAIYKAKTGALKYFLRGLGLIPDERDDPEFDEEGKEVTKRTPAEQREFADKKVAELREKFKAKPAMTKASDIIAKVGKIPESVQNADKEGDCPECEGQNGAHKWGCKNLKKPGAAKANPADAQISRWENIDLQKARKESDIPDEDYRAVLANNGCPTMHGPDIKMRDFPAILKEIQNYRREPNDPR